jgi:hypothetical protein
VCVAEGGQHHRAVQVDEARRRPAQAVDVGAASDGGDAAGRDRDGVGGRAAGVDGVDDAVRENQIGLDPPMLPPGR